MITACFMLLAMCQQPHIDHVTIRKPVPSGMVTITYDREAPTPSCTAGSCVQSLNDTCRAHAPVFFGIPIYQQRYIGSCDPNSVQMDYDDNQCSCTCQGGGNVHVTLQCNDRWLVNQS